MNDECLIFEKLNKKKKKSLSRNGSIYRFISLSMTLGIDIFNFEIYEC